MRKNDDKRPYAYRTGSVEFFLLPFRSDERALIPRLETESLVREVLFELRRGQFSTVVDVGTGSGIIAVSLAKNLPNIRMVGMDISEEALSLAKENAALHSVQIEFVESDLLSALPDWVGQEGGVFFVANLPYVRTGAQDLSEDTVFEPQIALYGGDRTGFELTERFLSEVETFANLHPNIPVSIACEVGDDHDNQIRSVAHRFGRPIRTFADPLGTPRFFTYQIWPS